MRTESWKTNPLGKTINETIADIEYKYEDDTVGSFVCYDKDMNFISTYKCNDLITYAIIKNVLGTLRYEAYKVNEEFNGEYTELRPYFIVNRMEFKYRLNQTIKNIESYINIM